MCLVHKIPNNKVHGANMGSIWGRQDPGGPQFGPTNFAIRDVLKIKIGVLSIFDRVVTLDQNKHSTGSKLAMTQWLTLS